MGYRGDICRQIYIYIYIPMYIYLIYICIWRDDGFQGFQDQGQFWDAYKSNCSSLRSTSGLLTRNSNQVALPLEARYLQKTDAMVTKFNFLNSNLGKGEGSPTGTASFLKPRTHNAYMPTRNLPINPCLRNPYHAW